MKPPFLTVVMPVYNSEKYLREAIDSILQQTFGDFELLIINDGSSDASLKIIKSYDDPRIRLLDLEKNKGIPFCRNLGLNEANGKFLCWADSDDISLPQRLEKQVDFLVKNNTFGGCGTLIVRFKGDKTYFTTDNYEHPEAIRASLLFRPATMPNPTVMLKLSKIRENNLQFNPDLPISEDYDFVFRCSRHFDFTNIQEVLYKYRDSESSIMKSFETKDKETFEINETIYRQVLQTLGITPSERDLALHHYICSEKIFETFQDFEDCCSWMLRLKTTNLEQKAYDAEIFNKVLADQFFFIAKKASKFGMKTLSFFVKKSLKNEWAINPIELLKLSVRCFLKHDKFEFRIN